MRSKCRSLTLEGSLTLPLAATPKNQPLRIHRSKVFRCLEAQSDVGSNDDDSLSREIDVFYWNYIPPLTSEEAEKGESSHDIELSLTEILHSFLTLCSNVSDDTGDIMMV